jgi:hypothetical protein
VAQLHNIFTHASVWALIETVAGELLQVATRWRRDRWYFLGSERRLTAPPLPPGWTWNADANAGFHVGEEIKHRVIGTQARTPFWRAPGLSAQIRVRWFPDPSRPKNTQAYLLIDFGQYLSLTEDELRRLEGEVPARGDPPPEAYESRDAWEAFCANDQRWKDLYGEKAQALAEMRKHFYTPQKTMIVRAWLNHAHNPYKAIRWVPRALKGTPGALAKWQTHLLDEEREARTQLLARGGAPFAWNWLCVSPQSSVEDLAFWLLLYLCQEQMIKETDDVLAFVTRYLRPFFKGVNENVGQTCRSDGMTCPAGDPIAGVIYEVFARLRKRYAFQAHWKGGPNYIRRVVRDVVKTSEPQLVYGIDPETAVAIQTRRQRGFGHARGHEESAKVLLAVDAAVRWLGMRGLPVSRETIYRWIRGKKIHATQNKRKGILLDKKALEQAEALVRLYLSRSVGRESDGGPQENI